MAELHPIIYAAGAEELPPVWAVMSPARRRHATRVGRVLWAWGKALGHDAQTRIRWRAAGLLHDVLKDERPEILRPEVEASATAGLDRPAGGAPGGQEAWPDPLLHGPACAHRLRRAGIEDEPLLTAIAFHTTGHRDFRAIGQALYMADFLEPGRLAEGRARAALRRRAPIAWRTVLAEVATARIGTLIDRRIPIPATTAEFWEGITAPAP